MGYDIKSIKDDFKKKGIFYTQKELALFLKSFLPNNITKVYDPTCGNGGLLSVFDDNVIKYGQELLEEQLNFANDTLINFNGIVGDTLINPAFIDKKFDYIIANPPFSIKWIPNIEDERFNKAPALAPQSKADYAFILHILHYLSEVGIAVILGFPGILYRGNSEYKIRKWLLENNYIEKVVFVPGDKFVDTKIATCILILNKNKKNTNILFIDDENKKERIVDFNEIVKNDYNLSVNNYIIKEQKIININPIELEYQARNNLIKKIKQELDFSKIVCKFENLDFNKILIDIEKVINNYKSDFRSIK